MPMVSVYLAELTISSRVMADNASIIRYCNNHRPFWFKVQEQICRNGSAITREIGSCNRAAPIYRAISRLRVDDTPRRDVSFSGAREKARL